MGKRELLIAAAFVAAATAAYRLAAPGPAGRPPRWTLSTILSQIRQDVHGNRALSQVTTRGTIGDLKRISDIRIAGMAGVTLVGEDRPDAAFELRVESDGENERAATDVARGVALRQDRVGPSLLLLRVRSATGRQTAHLVLRVPSRMTARIEGATAGTRIDARGVRALQLDGVVGDVDITEIEQSVTGTHRNGTLRIADAGAATLTLVASTLVLDRVRGAIAVSARNGRVLVNGAGAAVELDLTNADADVVQPRGAVRVSGSGGRVRVAAPSAPVSIDVHRTTVTVELAQPIDVTALTTDAPLRLRLEGDASVVVDALATDGGRVDAAALGVAAAENDEESRLQHAFGPGRATAALRNERGTIVIDRLK